MSQPQANPLRRIRTIALIGVALLAFIPIGFFVVWRSGLSLDVDRRLEALKSVGLPTSGAELNNWYSKVADKQNAALVLTQALGLLRNYPDMRSNDVRLFKLPERGHRLSTEQAGLLRGYVGMNSSAIARADQAINLPESRYPIDCSLCANTPLPHLRWLRDLAFLNQYKAMLAIDTTGMEDPSSAITTILGLARTLDDEPIVLSQLVRTRIIKIALLTLERTINSLRLNSGAMTTLVDVFSRTEATNRMARAIIGERAIYASYFRMSYEESLRITGPENDEDHDLMAPLPRKRPFALRLTGFFERDFRHFLTAMETNIALASLPPPRNLAADKGFAQATAVAQKRLYIASSSVLSGLTGVVAREVEGVAYLRLARTALAIEQFRNKQGRLPAGLEELKPHFLAEIPADPFDGAPLRYRQLPKGYVLYSVDRDGHDDGGREKPERKKASDKSSYDITFTVERW